MDVLSCATEKLSLDWPDEPHESQSSKLDERFLSGSGSRPTRRKLPFFPDLHQDVSRSWKQLFSSCLTNAATADFTNLVGSVEQGYTTVPAVEDMLAAHLSLNSAPSWKSRPLLPSKPNRTTSALIGKSYLLRSLLINLSGKGEVPHLVRSRRTAKVYLSISEMLFYTNCAILAAGNVSRSVGHFPSSADIEGKRHFRFSPLRVAAGCRYTRDGTSSAFAPRQYSLPSPLQPH